MRSAVHREDGDGGSAPAATAHLRSQFLSPRSARRHQPRWNGHRAGVETGGTPATGQSWGQGNAQGPHTAAGTSAGPVVLRAPLGGLRARHACITAKPANLSAQKEVDRGKQAAGFAAAPLPGGLPLQFKSGQEVGTGRHPAGRSGVGGRGQAWLEGRGK